jgi:hypothetical protein
LPEEWDPETRHIVKSPGELTRFRALRALTLNSDGHRAELPPLLPTLTRLVLDDWAPIEPPGYLMPAGEEGLEQSRLQVGDLVCFITLLPWPEAGSKINATRMEHRLSPTLNLIELRFAILCPLHTHDDPCPDLNMKYSHTGLMISLRNHLYICLRFYSEPDLDLVAFHFSVDQFSDAELQHNLSLICAACLGLATGQASDLDHTPF